MQVALARAAASGCETLLLGGAQLPADIFDPTRPERSSSARLLVDALRRADGVVIATPAYHGGVSGLVKNALDFTEDLRADDRIYLSGRAVGCIVCADGAQAMGSTLAALRAIVHALRGWPTPFGAAINATVKPFGAPGQAADPMALQACEMVADEVLQFVNMARRR